MCFGGKAREGYETGAEAEVGVKRGGQIQDPLFRTAFPDSA